MPLSQQQEAAVNAVINGINNINIIARAGCGKSYTLLEIVKAVKAAKPEAEISMVAYNTAIANELKQKVAPFGWGVSVQAATMHSVGNQAIGAYLKNMKGIAKTEVNGKKTELIVEDLKTELIKASTKADLSEQKVLGIQEKILICQNQKGFVTKAVSLAKQRAFGIIHPADQMEKWYDLVDHFGLDSDWDENEMKHSEAMIRLCVVVYTRSLDQVLKGKLDFDDMILAPLFYRCKIWPKDFVLVDEAQDLNPARRLLAIRMVGQTGRLICVGDPCQPLGTKVSLPNGGVKHIEDLVVGDRVVSYRPADATFLQNGQRVTGITRKPFTGDLVVASGSRTTKYTPSHRCLVNFNNLRDKHAVYLMRRGNQYRVGKCSMSYAESSGLSSRMRNEKAEAGWILSVHDTESEAFFWEQAISGKFGIPQLMFEAANMLRGPAATYLPEAWKFIGSNLERGEKCLRHFNRHPDFPLFSLNTGKQQTIKRPMIVYAANLMDGVKLLPYNGKSHTNKNNWETITVTHEFYEGDVVSLDVEDTHLYVADGYVTHNCQAIYGFTGADSDSMDLVKSAMNSQELPLNLTYRCPKAVVRVAQQWVPDFLAHDTNPEGLVRTIPMVSVADENGVKVPDFQDEVLDRTHAILCRNTKPLVEMAYTLIRRKIACRVEGREIGAGLIQMARRWKVVRLDAFRNRIESWRDREITKYRAKDREDMIQATEDKADTILCLIAALRGEGKHLVSDFETFVTSLFGDTKDGEIQKVLTLSTIHKSKGREWDRVYILGQNKYMPSKYAKKDWQMQQERNLQYVACTRSKSELVFIEV